MNNYISRDPMIIVDSQKINGNSGLGNPCPDVVTAKISRWTIIFSI